eukprot:TRINITY_DN21763_c0_g1_i1.p1 TRINITY_DN21763_c0_g1~~TRINITY_DN21763_c0_g1_i1.p1  ORF type:complete len:601 (+),score=76.44 TRINITY_DN21763_c0_g1_i1:247-1803(+)
MDAASVLMRTLPLPAVFAAASRAGNAAVLRLLLASAPTKDIALLRLGSDPKGKNTGPGILSVIAQQGDTDMLTLVLQAFKDRNCLASSLEAGERKADMPLHSAAAAGQAAACARLLEWGLDASVKDTGDRTPFYCAVQSGNVETVKVLADATPADLRLSSPGITLPLDTAIARGDAAMVETLMEFGATSSKKYRYMQPPLHRAIMVGFTAIPTIRALAKDINTQRMKNHLGETPLAQAARMCTSTEVLDVLLSEAPEDILNAENAEGYTPLMLAARAGRVGCVRTLAKRVPVDSRGKDDQTALMVAIKHARDETVKVLVKEFGADPFARDVTHIPVPMLASSLASYQALIEAGGQEVLTVSDGNGLNVFGMWAFKGEIKMINMMMKQLQVDCNMAVVTNGKGFQQLLDKEDRLQALHIEHTPRTALWVTRKRLESLIADRKTQSNRILLHYRTRQWAEPSDSNVREKLIERLSQVQTYLERQHCDGKESKHVHVHIPHNFAKAYTSQVPESWKLRQRT